MRFKTRAKKPGTGLFALAFFTVAVAADEIDALLVHPPVAASYTCSEHYAGQLKHLGDALGSDCVVKKLVEADGLTWTRAYQGEGLNNTDWYGWHEAALAPITGEVVATHTNENGENTPGIMQPGRSTSITLRRSDDTHVLVAHLRDRRVEAGDMVEAGQPIGMIGNNGWSRHPHLHLAAWRGETPLQLRFDQSRMVGARLSNQQ